jgi:hypothetical protein
LQPASSASSFADQPPGGGPPPTGALPLGEPDAGQLGQPSAEAADPNRHRGLRDAPTSFIERLDEEPRRRMFPVWVAVAALAVIIVIACIVVFLNLSGGGSGTSANPSQPAGATNGPSSPQGAPATVTPTPTPTLAVPAGYTVKANDAQSDCAAHAFGQVQTFFRQTPCTQVIRQLDATTLQGRPVILSLSNVTMPTPAAAASFKQLVDSDGTGNVNDLLREGVTYAGAPASYPDDNEYASAINGTTVRVVLAAFADGRPEGDPGALDSAAQKLASAF